MFQKISNERPMLGETPSGPFSPPTAVPTVVQKPKPMPPQWGSKRWCTRRFFGAMMSAKG